MSQGMKQNGFQLSLESHGVGYFANVMCRPYTVF